MFDGPIRPIQPVRAVRAVREVELRRRPAMGQLLTWLRFSRRVAARAGAQPDEAKPPPVDLRPGRWA